MKVILSFIFLIGTMTINAAAAAGRMEAKFQFPEKNNYRADNGSGKLQFVVRNTGDGPITFSSQQLPAAGEDGRLINDILEVTDPSGSEARYIGIFANFGNSKGTRQTLTAGASKIFEIDLPKNYAITPGVQYSISLRFGASYDEAGAVGTQRLEIGDSVSHQIPVGPISIILSNDYAQNFKSNSISESISSPQCTAEQEGIFFERLIQGSSRCG